MGGRNKQANNRDARRVAAVLTTSHIRTTNTKSCWTDPPANKTAENKCDTNADTLCLGYNFVVLNPTFRTTNVYAYDKSIKPIENIPTVSGATAYPDSRNETLYYGDRLDHALINPNQVCAFDIPFWDNPYDMA